MGVLFGSIIYLCFATIGILLGSLALLVGIFLSISEFLFAGPVIVLILVLGLIFRPLLPWFILPKLAEKTPELAPGMNRLVFVQHSNEESCLDQEIVNCTYSPCNLGTDLQ